MIIDMSVNKSSSKRKKSAGNSPKWQEAIMDAKQVISRLRQAIKYYQRMEGNGEPWPGEENASNGNSSSAK
jgi:hypothetical protein